MSWNEEWRDAIRDTTELERHHPRGGPGSHLDEREDLGKDDL